MTVVGGLRIRLMRDSLSDMLEVSMGELGWFDSGRDHQDVNFIDEPQDWDEPIDLNSIIVTTDTGVDVEAEMGSNLTEDTWTFFVDVYAEDESVGLHISNDLRDILRGKMPSIGRNAPILPVYDNTQATPPLAFTVDIAEVLWDRARGFPRPWQRYWYSIRCDLIDTYADEDDD